MQNAFSGFLNHDTIVPVKQMYIRTGISYRYYYDRPVRSCTIRTGYIVLRYGIVQRFQTYRQLGIQYQSTVPEDQAYVNTELIKNSSENLAIQHIVVGAPQIEKSI